MKWITRERPKIDRIACPWLIKRFIDEEAVFHFVPFKEVLSESKRLGATPYDIPDVEYTHYNDQCTFDYFVKKHELKDPALHKIATIVRAADTDRHNLAIQSAGLWAISAGLSHNISDDHELIEMGFHLYDALYSWASHLQNEKHTQNPTEDLLIEVYRKFLTQKSSKKTPQWVNELKEIIQVQIDTDLSLSLQEVSGSLQVHPSYLSREFSKYFDDISFGDYLRKLRIEKAIRLLETSSYSLAEIALITGFSDQSHFTRIFKKHTGLPPSIYKKTRINSLKK
ncbi:MAG: chromate resistance protein ChrB domain-containing protein [Cyclobacteriaceae bacterium]